MKIYLVILAIIILYFIISEFSGPVEILYFYNEKCIVSNIVDEIMNKTKDTFKNKVEIKYFEVSIFSGDNPEDNETTILKKKYNIQGTPVLIINEKEYNKAYEFKKISKEICDSFLVWPKECFFIFWQN